MQLIAYYEGAAETISWLNTVLGRTDVIYKKLPTSNDSKEFTRLPAYVADILNLDKPDIILSGKIDGDHEKPIFSIEFASCTPQYQHALQRFSRMMAGVINGCPSVIIIPLVKAENSGGSRRYSRSRAIEYGAVRLMDIFNSPAFVLDWEDVNGTLTTENNMSLPRIESDGIQQLQELLRSALVQFANIDYISALWRLPLVKKLVDNTRVRAYAGGAPSIAQPGGGSVGRTSLSNLDLLKTDDLLDEVKSKSTIHAVQIELISDFINLREQSLVFYPSRVTAHAGDPYVGMIGYYDIAFCRVGKSTRERSYNLVAYCKGVSINEINKTMQNYNKCSCPFVDGVNSTNLEKYSYHLKYGCKLTKSKPVRIYAELADLVIFDDGIIYNAG